ncbi:thioredoxin family protein [Stutzerimonas tarimensis]|uniref:Thioredoxin family protein n=1 Tax=Stutzerimonas tarimensis TaxID=1507735 RepID=A0ABV7T2R3_9GAMM
MTGNYSAVAPSRAEVESMPGVTLLEFGTDWCGYCQAAQPAVDEALAGYAHVRHLKVEDGKGRALGRAFKVKLWPTLIFLRDGIEVDRVVRPRSAAEVAGAFARAEA